MSIYYILLTALIPFISLIGFIIITVKSVKNKKLSGVGCFWLIIFLIGMYLYIPYNYYRSYRSSRNPEMLKTALKYSINPVERQYFYAELGIHYYLEYEGNKAIEYLEKAIKGDYKNNPGLTKLLIDLYSLKGEDEKTFEIAKKGGLTNNISLVNIYLTRNDYQKASEVFPKSNSEELFLKADIYRKLGDEANYAKTYAKAERIYNSKMSAQKSEEKRTELQMQKTALRYKNINSYKNWLAERRANYKF